MLVSKKISTNPSYNTEEAKVGVIQEIRGNSVYWNQLVGQTPSSTYWYAYAGNFSRSVDSNYNFIITPNSSTSGPFQATSSFLTDDDNNKYIYWRVNGYVNRETTVQIRFGTITQKTITVNGNFTVSGIRPPRSSNNYRYFIIRAFHGETPSGSDTLIIRPGTILVDLTKMYWWSNTIPTVSEFENQFLTESSYPKLSGDILSTKYDSIGVYADNSLASEISLNITDSLPNGLRSAKNAYDSAIIENGYLTGFIKRISGANLGNFSWEYLEESETFKASFPSLKIPDSGEPNVICGKYQVVSKEYQDANDTGEYTDITVAIDVVDNQAYIYIKGTNYTTVSDFTSSAVASYAIWYETEPEEILLQTPVSLSYNCGDYEQTVTSSDRSAPLFVTINYSTDIINKIRFNDETHFVQDWRISGIDAEPIGGSINLVTSNGIYQEINNLNNNKEDISNKTDELNSFSSSDEYPSASAVVNYVGQSVNSSLATEITYSDLVTLRSNNGLIPGKKYRITDYVTKVNSSYTATRSVGHQFDIIVIATSTNTLSEEASAALHSGDTYFANTKFDAWKMWYCLDNDTSRFAWANTSTGKGVVYRLIDEWNNDLPYDFKSIQHIRWKVTNKTAHPELACLNGLYIGIPNTYTYGMSNNTSDGKWYYVFSKLGDEWTDDVVDASIAGTNCFNNTFENVFYDTANELNNIVIANGNCLKTYLLSQNGNNSNATTISYSNVVACNNHFGEGVRYISIFGATGNVYTLSQFRRNTIVGDVRHIEFSTDVQDNTIVATSDFCFNKIYDLFEQNAIVVYYKSINDNTFGAYFRQNVIVDTDTELGISRSNIKEYCSGNKIYGGIQGLTLHSLVSDNTFGSSSSPIRILQCIFGPYTANNTFTKSLDNTNFLGFNRNITCNTQISNCVFNGRLQYVTIPSDNSDGIFNAVTVSGNIVGASGSEIALDYSGFYSSSSNTTSRRINIEADSSNGIIATWQGSNGMEGVKKVSGDNTWVPIYNLISTPTLYVGNSSTLTSEQKAHNLAVLVSNQALFVNKNVYLIDTTDGDAVFGATLNTVLPTGNTNEYYVDFTRLAGFSGTTVYQSESITSLNGDLTWGAMSSVNFLLSDKISTSVSDDSSSNDKVSSPKSVYDYVNTKLTSVLKYKGTIGSSGATISSLPATHSVGDVYVVKTAGTYAGKACEIGDYIICNTAGTSANNAHWDVVNGENQVENKSASLAAAGSSATIATIDGTDITVTTPSGWTGLDKVGTITKVGTTSSGDVTVSSSNNTASFGSSVTVGTVGGVDLKFTMPSNPNTDNDTQVTQTKTASSNTSNRPLLLGYSYSDDSTFNPSTVTNTAYATHLAKFKPSTGVLSVVGLNKMNSNGTMATGSNTTVWNTNGGTASLTDYLALSGGTMSGAIEVSKSTTSGGTHTKGINISDVGHIGGVDSSANEGVGIYSTDKIWLRPKQTDIASGTVDTTKGVVISDTSLTYNGNDILTSTSVSSSNNTASWGSAVTVGTVGGTDLKFTMPANPDTDTKNTAGSTDTSSKIYLIGATSQDANPQTYSDNEVYATSGVLTTKSVQVGGTAATMQYNSTDNSIEFIFT